MSSVLAAFPINSFSISRYDPGMRNRIRELREKRNWTQEQLADAVGSHHTTINKLESGKQQLNEKWLTRMGKVFGVDPVDIFLRANDNAPAIAGPDVISALHSVPDHRQMPVDVPVRGTAAGAQAGSFQLNINAVAGYKRRPPALDGVEEAYAIYVTNDSMAPEHKDGDLRFVNPNWPPKPGDTVIIQILDEDGEIEQAFIKRLVRRTEKAVICEQLNPPETINYTPGEIKIHKVLSMNELFGG